MDGAHPLGGVDRLLDSDRAQRTRPDPGHVDAHPPGRVGGDKQIRAEVHRQIAHCRCRLVVVVCVGHRGRRNLFPDAFACLGHDIGDGQPRGFRCPLRFSDTAQPPLGCGQRSLVDGCLGSDPAQRVVAGRPAAPVTTVPATLAKIPCAIIRSRPLAQRWPLMLRPRRQVPRRARGHSAVSGRGFRNVSTRVGDRWVWAGSTGRSLGQRHRTRN